MKKELNGKLERWNNGNMKKELNGKLECWKNGNMGKLNRIDYWKNK